jgi:hypothetical protein
MASTTGEAGLPEAFKRTRNDDHGFSPSFLASDRQYLGNAEWGDRIRNDEHIFSFFDFGAFIHQFLRTLDHFDFLHLPTSHGEIFSMLPCIRMRGEYYNQDMLSRRQAKSQQFSVKIVGDCRVSLLLAVTACITWYVFATK